MEHNNRLIDKPRIIRFLVKCLLRRASKIYVVSDTVKNSYSSIGISCSEGLHVSHSYVPPPWHDAEQAFLKYPSELREFVLSNDFILVSGYKLVFENGKDLYGFDTAVETLSKLAEEFQDVKLLIAIPELDEDAQEYIYNLVRNASLDKSRIYLLGGGYELWPLMRHAKVFLRPTVTDGFGISVAEAVDSGCTAIASDVCTRYPGTLTYSSSDNRRLLELVKKSLSIRR